MYTCIYACTCINTYMCMETNIHAYITRYTCCYIIHLSMHTYMYLQIYTNILIHVYIYTYVDMYVRTEFKALGKMGQAGLGSLGAGRHPVGAQAVGVALPVLPEFGWSLRCKGTCKPRSISTHGVISTYLYVYIYIYVSR